jgi:hypothetical protein
MVFACATLTSYSSSGSSTDARVHHARAVSVANKALIPMGDIDYM